MKRKHPDSPFEVILSVRMYKNRYEKLHRIAKRRGQSLSDLVRLELDNIIERSNI